MAQLAQPRYGEWQFVGAFVDHEQREKLVEVAREQDRSVSALLRRAIAEYLREEPKA